MMGGQMMGQQMMMMQPVNMLNFVDVLTKLGSVRGIFIQQKINLMVSIKLPEK
jgi:hypothetical protein